MHESDGDDARRGSRGDESRVADRLKHLRRRRFVGREGELTQLQRCTEPDGPAVSFLPGTYPCASARLFRLRS
jgi:hypothetical protein